MSLKSLATAVALAASTLAVPAFAEDLTFTLTNASSLTITHFYTSPTDVGNWEEDVFGDGVLEPGSSVQITIADGREQCEYDLKFKAEDGQEVTDNANLCELGSYTLHD